MTSHLRDPVLEAVGLHKYFTAGRLMSSRNMQGSVKAVAGVSLAINRGETLGIVGESGCGKTTTARMVLWVERPSEGDILFHGQSLQEAKRGHMRRYRSSVQAVFQDPWSSLNPRMRVGRIVAEPLKATRSLSKAVIEGRVRQLLSDVGLPPASAGRFPHELSGGQRQRVAIARALSSQPELVVLDEPVSALDVSIRAQIMNLLKELQKKYGMSYLLIAHDMATVRHLSDRVAVMYLGKIVEEGIAASVLDNPLHPYTKTLVSASLPTHLEDDKDEIVAVGEVPSAINPPPGCPFHPRCPHAMPECSTQVPEAHQLSVTQSVSCHLYRQDTREGLSTRER